MIIMYLLAFVVLGFFFNFGMRISNYFLGRIYSHFNKPKITYDYEIKEKGDFIDE